MSRPALSKPGRIVAIDGEVVQDGPDGVGISMTPDAAQETGERLKAAADEARTQPPNADPEALEP